MKKIIKGKQILIIGIISVLTTGIILSSNWSYFVKNNNNKSQVLSSYHINADTNPYLRYSQVEDNIMFQINVLNSAVNKNNIMYKQYSNVFKNNMSYARLQKSVIKNRVNVANSSIKHELDVLNNMKTIIKNHPYNYLKFFQGKNYILPTIMSQKVIDASYSLSNIETYTQNINNSDTSLKNISYQSEEAAIGIGAITSVVSASKSLIFSKVHFDYNSLYYFSNETNSLSTEDKTTTNIKLADKKVAVININEFINNGKKSNKDVVPMDKIKFKKPFKYYLSYLCYYLTKHRTGFIIGTTSAAAIILTLGIIGVSLKFGFKSHTARVQEANYAILTAYSRQDRTMDFTAFKKQAIRYARTQERPNLIPTNKEDIKVNINDYILIKKTDAPDNRINEGIFTNLKRITNLDAVPNNRIELEEGETATTYGWFKMPAFEQNGFDNLTEAQKADVRHQITSFEELLRHIPSIEEKNRVREARGRDIAIEIFGDLRQVVQSHLDHLNKYRTDVTTIDEDPTEAGYNSVVRGRYEDFLRDIKLRKTSPGDVSHIPNIGPIEQKLAEIAEFGVV